jgi:predicted TPR repeat methyltransferase
MNNPKINPVILLSPVENGYVAYDPIADRLHQLNPMAALLAELCDGQRSIEDIRALVAPIMPADKRDELDRWFEDGLKAGLIVPAGSDAPEHRVMTPEELYNLAKRLKENGNVQPAFLCAQRAVELKPDYWDAWYDLGDLAQSVGRREDARAAYQAWFDAHPDDAEIEHLLIALRDDAPPARASDRTIQQIYKDFAWNYETRMLKDLDYKGPERVLEGIQSVIGTPSNLAVLDLGCGSGLSGLSLKQFASNLTGVDLSPEMIELARARNIYDRLEVAEITDWLRRNEESYDLVASCDCLIYFGDLTEIARAVAKRLKPGGVFALTTEACERYPFQLTDTGRYAHHPDHIRDAAKAADLKVGYLQQAFLRMEYGSEVTGNFAVLVKG